MQQPFHRRFRDAQARGQGRVGNILALRRQAAAQSIENASPPARLAFFAQARQRLLDHRGRPANIEESFRTGRIERSFRQAQMRRRVRHPIIPGNEFEIAAPFLGLAFLVRIDQEILERLEQEGTEPSAFRIGALQEVSLKHGEKKILGQILGIGRGIAAAADESENGPPIELAKLCQSRVRGVLRSLPRPQERRSSAWW